MDDRYRLVGNQVLERLAHKNIAAKAQEYIEAYVQGRPLAVGDLGLMGVSIEGLRTSQMAVLCVEVWTGGKGELVGPLEEDIQEALAEVGRQGVKQLAISEVNEEFGIPKQVGQKTLCRAMAGTMEKGMAKDEGKALALALEKGKEKEGLRSIRVMCSSQESAEEHEKAWGVLSLERSVLSRGSDYF